MARGVNQEGGSAIHAGLEQSNALLGSPPAFHHHIIQLLAQKLVHHGLMLAAYLKKICQRAYRRTSWSKRTRFQQPPHCVGRVPVIANQRLQRLAPSGHGSLLAAQFIGARALRVLLGPPRLQGFAQSRNLAFQPLECPGRDLKFAPGLSALHS